MSVKCELYLLFFTCVKLRSPLKIPITFRITSSGFKAHLLVFKYSWVHDSASSRGSQRTSLATEDLQGSRYVVDQRTRAKFDDWADLLHRRVQDHRLDVNICSTQDNSKGERATVCFGSIQGSSPKRNIENTRRSFSLVSFEDKMFF